MQQAGCADVEEIEVRDVSSMATPPLHQQVSIRSSTGPSAADRCSRKTEGCRGMKEAINISPCSTLPVSLRLYTSLFSFGPPSLSICPTSLVLRFYMHPPLLSFCYPHLNTATMQTNHSNTDSDLHLNRLPPCKIFISLFLSALLTSQEVRETTDNHR